MVLLIQRLLDLLPLGDITGGCVDEVASRKGSPLDPAIRAIAATVPVREIQHGLPGCQAAEGFQCGFQVIGMHQVQETAAFQLG